MELRYRDDMVLSNRQSATLFNAISTQTMPAANFIRKTNAELMQVALIGRKWLSDKARKMGDGKKWTQRCTRCIPHGRSKGGSEWLKKDCQRKEKSMVANIGIWTSSTATVLALTLNFDLQVDGDKIKHYLPMRILIKHCSVQYSILRWGRRVLNAVTNSMAESNSW